MQTNYRFIRLLLWLAFLVAVIVTVTRLVHADYTVHTDRLIDVTGWKDEEWASIKVIYDTQGHVDCYLFKENGSGQGSGISCIQK